jgi:hypothetical protein
VSFYILLCCITHTLLCTVSHELQYVVGMLQYVQARLSAPQTIQAARKSLHLQISESNVGSFLNLHCGHNNPFSKVERKKLQSLLDIGMTGDELRV